MVRPHGLRIWRHVQVETTECIGRCSVDPLWALNKITPMKCPTLMHVMVKYFMPGPLLCPSIPIVRLCSPSRLKKVNRRENPVLRPTTEVKWTSSLHGEIKTLDNSDEI